MEIYLIRHTKTATEKGLCYGQSDVALADSFFDEKQAVHAKLPVIDENALLFSSPLQRCMTLANTFSRPVITDVRLKEIDFGVWENVRFDEIDSEMLTFWTNNFVTQAPPNGETFNDLYKRAASFWDELIKTDGVRQAVIVTHAGVIRALLAYILPLPLANAFKFQIDTGSVHKFRFVNHYTYVEYINH